MARGIYIKLSQQYDETSSVSRIRTCVLCWLPVEKFSDELSEREYRISGLCETCQDKIFKEEED